ncbi:hypothetical protein [Dechloromonas sp. ZS-1]|uniref:hypothetical protein n=1 Tax=Dechloromonas sp. ZS-1 TaxID=3138067 RepID=UPI0031FBB4BB
MPIEQQLEIAQLLARFKLQVKRTLAQSVDLEKLTRDPAYARQRLAEIEEDAADEGLLVMVLRLRDLLLPPASPPAAELAPAIPTTPAAAPTVNSKETRNYLMGARAW